MNPLSSVGTGELILILVIALLFLGPERLPEIVRSVGKTIRQFRDALQSMSAEFGEELASVQEVTRDLQEGIRAVQEVRNLSQTMISSATAPLIEAVEEAKAAAGTASTLVADQLEEAKRAVEVTLEPTEAQAEESEKTSDVVLAPTETQSEDSTLDDEEETPTETESPPEDEPRVKIEDDQV